MKQTVLYKQVNNTAKAAKEAGQTIEINYRLPYVAVKTGSEEYFFQGEEADNLIEETRNSSLHMFCPIENIILWQAQGW